MTRGVKWMVAKEQYTKFNTTRYISGRRKATFEASTTSRRLIMFQVWFSRSNGSETLHSYNQRLGRPSSDVRDGILPKTKAILQMTLWRDYFDELGLSISVQSLDMLLRYSVYNSMRKRYHYPARYSYIQAMKRPVLYFKNEAKVKRNGPLKISGQRNGTAWSKGQSAARNLWNLSGRFGGGPQGYGPQGRGPQGPHGGPPQHGGANVPEMDPRGTQGRVPRQFGGRRMPQQ